MFTPNPKSSFRLGLWFVLALLASAGMLRLVSGPALAAAPQGARHQIPIFTPTPGPDGRIIYIVKENDTLLSISLVTGVPVTELRALNNLNSDTIVVGQRLLLGLAGPAEATQLIGPTPTATPVLPTPSPKPGSGDLCILLFDDQNGDSIRQEEEPSLAGGAVSVSNRSGSFSKSIDTQAGTDPSCFEGAPEGDYSISVGVPGGYNPTTETTYAVTLKAGEKVYIDFGAQPNASGAAAVGPQEPASAAGETSSTSGRSPLLGLIGGLFLLVGVGLAVFAGRLLKSR